MREPCSTAAQGLSAPQCGADFDCHDPRAAIKAMGAADLVVAMASYRSFARTTPTCFSRSFLSRRHRHLHQLRGADCRASTAR